MSIINWLVLAIIIVTLVEVGLEIRKKRYWAAFVSALIATFLIYMWLPMFQYLFSFITGGTKP